MQQSERSSVASPRLSVERGFGRMGIRKRQKAGDVFKEGGGSWLGTTTFDKAYPMIADFTVKVTESDGGPNESTRVYNRHIRPGEYINCSNPLCYNGGFDLGSILREMTYQARETRWSGSRSCQGYEGSPKGRKKYGPCFNRFEVAVEITYKDDA
jgi:hypothetical protein